MSVMESYIDVEQYEDAVPYTETTWNSCISLKNLNLKHARGIQIFIFRKMVCRFKVYLLHIHGFGFLQKLRL